MRLVNSNGEITLVRGAHMVVELPGGTLQNRVAPGDNLKLE